MTESFFLHTSHFEGLSSVSERSKVIFLLARMPVLWQLKVRKVGHFHLTSRDKGDDDTLDSPRKMFISRAQKNTCIILCR